MDFFPKLCPRDRSAADPNVTIFFAAGFSNACKKCRQCSDYAKSTDPIGAAGVLHARNMKILSVQPSYVELSL